MPAQRSSPTSSDDDGWGPYVGLRRAALRELARVANLTYFTKRGIFGAIGTEEGAGGGIWALRPDVGPRLTRALDAGAPDWVALTEPALALLPLVRDHGCALEHSVLAMGMATLSGLPVLPMPPNIRVQPVNLIGDDESISLEEALLVDMLHGGTDAASARRDLPLEADALRHLTGITLLAAVDDGGSCVATAGTRLVGRTALVSAVATIPQYRRRGIATALTGAALRAARANGATRAFLDASDGESLYARLGFQPIGTVMRCERASAES